MNEPISRLLRNEVDPAAIDRVAARLRERPRRGATRVAWVGAVGLAAAVFLWVVLRGEAPAERRLASGAPLVHLVAASGDEVFSLSDGTELGLAAGAQLDRIQNDGARLVLRQSVGRVRYRVAPQGAHAFVVEAGAATVEVVGTEFTVDRHRADDGAESVEVQVMHGVVVVRSALLDERVARVEAGGRVLVAAAPREPLPASVRVEQENTENAENAEAHPVQASATALSPAPRRPAPPPAVPEPATPTAPEGDPVLSEESDDVLLARADAYRREGRVAEARALLERVVSHGQSPQSSLAALSLGVLLDDALHDGARAEQALEHALSLGLPSAVVGAAWSRLAELRGERGDMEGAHAAAARAIEAGVSGRERTRAERWR